MDHFELVSEYQPTGDQPQAIAELVRGFKEGNQFETLLGVTGSGKTLTMANVIQALNRPTPVSYTHLDVYKRQILSMLSASPAGVLQKQRLDLQPSPRGLFFSRRHKIKSNAEDNQQYLGYVF